MDVDRELRIESSGRGTVTQNGDQQEAAASPAPDADRPEASRSEPVGFGPGQHVVVQEMDDSNWQVVAPLSYTGQRQTFEVPLHMETDFASVPRPLVWFLPRYGRYTKAAIVHDYLWRKAVPAGEITRREADAIFRRAMRQLEVAFLRRWLMWSAVRWGALSKKDGRKDWLKDAWRIIPLTALALPIVVPPALLVVAALVVFYFVELVFWAPLKIASMVKKPAVTEPAVKRVNTPSLLIKL